MANKTFNTRVKNKRDTAANWEAVATTFQPLDGELIIVDTAAGKTRFKVGRYDTAKGRLLYYNEIPFTDEYLYNDLNESQGKIYDKLKGIDDKSIIEMTLEPSDGNGKVCVYHIGLWQFPKTGLYKIHLTQHGTTSDLFKVFARKTKDDGTLPEDFTQDNIVIQHLAMGDTQVNDLYIQVDYIDNDKLTVYNVKFLTLLQPYNAQVNTYDKTTQKWQFVSATYVQSAKSAGRLAHQLTLTKGDTTTKFDGSTAQTVEIPTKTSELTNDSFVSYAEQILTEDQQNQAKTNLGIDILTGNTTTVTPTQVKEAILAGRPIAITYTDTTYGNLTFTSFGYSLENNVVVANLVATSNFQYILADLTGIINTNGWVLQTTELGTSTDIANNYVKYSKSQTLTDEQKATARTNIGAISSSELVQSDWNQNDETAKDYIKNRFGGYVEESSVATTLYDATPDRNGEVEITLFPLNTKVGTITIDGVATTYTCVTETISEQQCVSFGTATLAEIYSGTTDAIVAASTGTTSIALIGSSYVGKHIVISIGGEVVHTIPTKFIDNNFVNKVNNAVSMATAAQKDVDKIKSDGLSYTGSRDGIAFIGVDTYGNAEISRKRSEDSAEGMDIQLASAGLTLSNHGRYGKLTSYVVMSTTGTTDNPALYLKKARIAGVNEPEDETDAATKKYVDIKIQAINNQLGGLTGAMHFIGKATVDITDGSTTDPVITDYDFTNKKEKGDVILGKDDHKEFVWNGSAWEELGDEGSYVLKTTTINGKALSGNITLTAADVGAASASTIETMQAAIDSKPSAADAVYTATAASTDGVAYTATVSGIDSLTVGASFIMIPNKASTSKAPTLNVNGLGAKPIRRRLSSLTTSLQQGYSTNWIALNKPFTVVYDGTAWVIEGLTKTDGADVYGAVAQATADAKGNNIADTYATIAMLQSLLPKVTTITLTSNWVGDASPYYQDIALSCVTETSIVDLQPTPEQLNSWQDDGIAFTTLSGNGTVRVYVAGGKPSSAISVQVRVQEVTVI